MKQIVFLFLLQQIFFGSIIYAGKEASRLAQEKKNIKKIISFDCISALTMGSSAILRYTYPDQKIIPIFSTSDYSTVYKIIKKPVSLETYKSIARQRRWEARKRIFTMATGLGLGFLGFLVSRYNPEYGKFLYQNVLSKPVFWGITLPPALFTNIESFNPRIKLKQARLIEDFIAPNPKVKLSCDDPEVYIKKFRGALGV